MGGPATFLFFARASRETRYLRQQQFLYHRLQEKQFQNIKNGLVESVDEITWCDQSYETYKFVFQHFTR